MDETFESCVHETFDSASQAWAPCMTLLKVSCMKRLTLRHKRGAYVRKYALRLCVRMYVCTCVRMYVHIYVCTSMYVRMYVCTYARMYVCTYARMHVYVRMYACTYVRMYLCTYGLIMYDSPPARLYV